ADPCAWPLSERHSIADQDKTGCIPAASPAPPKQPSRVAVWQLFVCSKKNAGTLAASSFRGRYENHLLASSKFDQSLAFALASPHPAGARLFCAFAARAGFDLPAEDRRDRTGRCIIHGY